jgi:hypothetical protein
VAATHRAIGRRGHRNCGRWPLTPACTPRCGTPGPGGSRISGAAWMKDGGLALDIVMANTATARTFYAVELADTRWPMYAHPVTAAPPADDYRKLHQLVAVRLYPIASWPTAVVRVVRPPESRSSSRVPHRVDDQVRSDGIRDARDRTSGRRHSPSRRRNTAA